MKIDILIELEEEREFPWRKAVNFEARLNRHERKKRDVGMALLLKTEEETFQPLLHQHGSLKSRETWQSKGCWS